MQDIKLQIHTLVKKYEQNRDFYCSSRFNETELCNQFLDPLFEALGWDIRNVANRSTSEREVLLEESLRENASTHSKKPDYTFRLYGERKFFLEAKKPCVRIEEDNEPAKQVRRYGFTAGLKISVLSNFEYLFIYETSSPVEDNDTLTKYRVKEYHYTSYEDAAEDLLKYLGKESVYSGQFDSAWEDITLNVDHKSIDKLFLDQINSWRKMLGMEIYSYAPNIDADFLSDIVQSYINKILFLRVCEDRNIETYQALLSIAENDSYSALIQKFREADRKYNSGLFDELLSENVIGQISSSFWVIIRQLYYPESPYSFAVLSSDILGRIYEIFLAQKIAIQDGEVVLVDKPENIERDIVTTPNYIVREILNQTVNDIIREKTDLQLNELRCADIACGSGAFLLELYQLLCDALVDYYVIHNPSQLIRTNVDSYRLPYKTKCRLLTNCIYGFDKDYNAVEACKFGLLLKLLEDEDLDTLSDQHPILPKMDNNIFYGNSLLSPRDVPEELADEINPFDFGDRRFDLIVGNPPYMKTEDIKNFTPSEKKLYQTGNRYVCAHKQYDKYYLFIERALTLLKEGGYLGYIVPSKFMKVGAAKPLRGLIAKGKFLRALTFFGAHQVFEDKSTYTCIIVLQKGENALSTYRTFKPNARVIFPYQKNAEGRLELMSLPSIERNYPFLHRFLLDFQSELAKPSRNIQPAPVTPDEWYRYGRHQCLEACEISEKIIVGVLAQTDKYAVDTQGTLVSSGGTAGYCMISLPETSNYSIYYIQALLGSLQGEWLASLYGEIFRGGYIARGTKVLKQIPIRTINFDNPIEVSLHDEISERQRTLIELGERIANMRENRRRAIPLNRQFEALKEEQQSAINRLYGLTTNEASRIPIIKNIYAVN